jgi:hypothetical protein
MAFLKSRGWNRGFVAQMKAKPSPGAEAIQDGITRRKVLGATPNTAGGTPALPKNQKKETHESPQ